MLRFGVLWALMLLCGCQGHAGSPPASPPAAQRVLGVVNVPKTLPDYRPEDGAAAVRLMREAGARAYVVSATWRELEPAPGTFALDALAQEAAYARSLGFTVLLSLQVINTTDRETPDDLQALPFDAPEVQGRFRALLRQLDPTLRRDVTYLAVGNEVDGYLEASGGWAAYGAFYREAVAHLHRTLPALEVGVTLGYGALSAALRPEAEVLVGAGDTVVFTYYPVDAGFQVVDADAGAVLDEMVAFAAGKPVLIQEFGYPTAPGNGGTEAGQADFVREGIAAWRSRDPAALPFFAVFALHDLPASLCDTLADYYGAPDNPAFEGYLCSLGLRRADGTPKAGWRAFTESLRVR